MANVNVISVNPSKKTTAELNPEILNVLARKCRPADMELKEIRLKSILNLVTGININTTSWLSQRLLISRVIIGLTMIALAFTANIDFTQFNVAYIVFALALAIICGFAQRTLSTIAAIVCLSMAATYMSGLTFYQFMDSAFSLPVISTAFEAILWTIIFGALALFGPGIYSADQMIRRKTFRTYKNKMAAVALREADARMTYKAFQVTQ